MRIGIFGDPNDLQCQRVAEEAAALGAETVLFEAGALDAGVPCAFDDQRILYRGEPVDDLAGCYLRFIPTPYVPALQRDETLVLYEDWYAAFMQTREKASYFMSWLLMLAERRVRLVNPPHGASVLQYKPFQLQALREAGARVPRTLITNDPAAVRAFLAEVKDVIYKPLMGGAATRPLDVEALETLDAITASPVIFQERVAGEDLRVMLVGDVIVSSVAIETPSQHLDFRDDPVYRAGQCTYREVQLPAPVVEQCRKAARACNLVFAGIDIKRQRDAYVFLELNSSPIYLDVEVKLGHRISRAIAQAVTGLGAHFF